MAWPSDTQQETAAEWEARMRRKRDAQLRDAFVGKPKPKPKPTVIGSIAVADFGVRNPQLEELPENGSMRHAWFSAQMARTAGKVIYADEKGNHVVCTTVTTKTTHNTNWPDMEYRGKVVKFIKRA